MDQQTTREDKLIFYAFSLLFPSIYPFLFFFFKGVHGTTIGNNGGGYSTANGSCNTTNDGDYTATGGAYSSI